MWRLCHAARGGRTALRAKCLAIWASGQVEDVDRAGALADGPEPVPDRVAGDRAGGPRRLERAVAERQVGRQSGRVGAARSVRGAVCVALPRNQVDGLAVVEDVGGLLPVTAGDHDRLRPEVVEGAGERLGVAL